MACEKHYDLNLLIKSELPIDRLIRFVSSKNRHLLKMYQIPNRIWDMFYDIAPELIKAFSRDAHAHIQHIKENHEKNITPKYSYLFLLAEKNSELFNSVNLDYEHFPLMLQSEFALKEIRTIAQKYSKPHTNEFDATCLYLIYFYALLINPDYNWTVMDYISNGNKYHQFGTKLGWKIETRKINKWIA